MIRRAQPWLGTLVEMTVAAAPDPAAHEAIARAFAEVALVHHLMSFHAADSDVSRLNRAAVGERLEVHPHTWQVLQLAQRVSALSDAIFDVGCAPQLVAWDYLPAPAAAAPVFRQGLVVACCEPDGTVRKAADGWIDLGGIAKGYAVDLAIAALLDAGIGSACVNAGGDLRVLGAQPFSIGVRDPRHPQRAALQLDVCDEALATSATYFSAKPHDGRPVSALVDGRTGAALAGRGSVSVLAPSCAVADALTKVVAASGDARHPALAAMHARAFII